MTVTKAHLVERLFSKLQGYGKITRSDCARYVETVFELLKQTLGKGEDVLISGFGKFSVKSKSQRRGRNPQTGDSIVLPPRKVVTFKCSGVLRSRMNNTKS